MASTLLYSHAPASVFDNFASVPNGDNTSKPLDSWTTPALELSQLYAMAQSLPKGDFEITPVQAWFLLVARYDQAQLLGKLERLRKDLASLVDCYCFGAAMDETKFWNVVEGIMADVDNN
jgi:hypothetical protein